MNEERKRPRNADYDNNDTTNNESISTTHRLILPYKGEQGQKIIKSVNNYVKKLLPQNHAIQHVYNWSLDIKGQTKLEHKHDLTYVIKCLENRCSERYLGEAARRLYERTMEHAGKDDKPRMLKHTFQSGHLSVSPNSFRILQKRHNNNKIKTKISKTLLIRKHHPSLPPYSKLLIKGGLSSRMT